MKEYSESYRNAATEALVIMENTERSVFRNVPAYIINRIKNIANKDYPFKIERGVPLEEQKLLPETREILANLFIRYCSTSKEKENLKDIYIDNTKKEEKVAQFKDYNELFKREKKEAIKEEIKEETVSEELQMVEVKKETWLQRIWNKIKSFIKR